MKPPRRLAYLPPMFVGASCAIAAEVALGLLLYAGAGLLRSLTAVLAVEAAALAGGLWSAPHPGPGLVDRLRRRWLVALVAFVGAATYGTAWSALSFLGTGRGGQALGVVFLAALPIYACGMVLGGLAVAARDGTTPGLAPPGASAALGAAGGFILTGTLLPKVPIPASLLLACLVLLSAGGMSYGALLGGEADPGEEPEAGDGPGGIEADAAADSAIGTVVSDLRAEDLPVP